MDRRVAVAGAYSSHLGDSFLPLFFRKVDLVVLHSPDLLFIGIVIPTVG